MVTYYHNSPLVISEILQMKCSLRGSKASAKAVSVQVL